MVGAHDRLIKPVGFLAVTAYEGQGGPHPLKPPQSLGHHGFAQATPLVGRDCRHRLEVGAAGYIVEPDGTEGCNGPVGCHSHEVEVPAVKRGGLDVTVPGRILAVVYGDLDVASWNPSPEA